jgi:hypothetical protein
MTTTPAMPKPRPRRLKPKPQIVVGSIIERPRIKKDGTAYTVYRVQYNSPLDGLPIERTFSTLSYGTKRKAKLAAETWLAGQREAMRTGTWVDPREPVKVDPSRITVAEVAERWRGTWNDRPLSAKTQLGYRALLDGRVLPRWGKVRVGSITSQDVQAWLRDLTKSKANPGNNHDHHPADVRGPSTDAALRRPRGLRHREPVQRRSHRVAEQAPPSRSAQRRHGAHLARATRACDRAARVVAAADHPVRDHWAQGF